MNEVQVAEQEVKREEAEVTNQICLEVGQLKIDSPETYDRATDILKDIKTKQKSLEDRRKQITQPIDLAKKRIMDLFRPVQKMLFDAELSVKKGVLLYMKEQDRIRAEKEAGLREKARKAQEKLDRASERKATRLEEKGNPEEADLVRESVPQVSMPVLENEIPKTKGISKKIVWRHRIVNSDKVPDEYKIIDEKKIGAVVRATKGAIKISGVEIFPEEIVAAGSSI